MKCIAKFVAAMTLVGCATTSTTSAERTLNRVSTTDGKARATAINHYLTSEIYKYRGDFKTWLGALESAAAADPESLELQIRLINAHRLFRNYDRAIQLAEASLETHPDDVSLYIWLGRLHFENGEVDRSIQTFEGALEIDPTSTRALEALAELRDQTNDLVAEVELYERLVTVAPESAQLYYELGSSLYQLGDKPGAEDALQKSLAMDPSFGAALYLLGALKMDVGEYEAAVELFRTFLIQTPDHGRARANLAVSIARTGDYDGAMAELTNVIESAEVEPIHHLYRMYLMLRMGGKPAVTEAIAPSSAPIFGSLLVAMVRKEAGEPYERMLTGLDVIEGDLDAECARYLNNLLVMFGPDDAGPFLEARFVELIDEGYRSKALETIRARALMSTDRSREAEPLLKEILERYGDDKWTHYYLASVYEALDSPAQVELHLRECLRLNPDDPDVLNFLGYYLADRNEKLEEAEQLILRALEFDPENGFYLDSLGWVYYRQGKGPEAVDHIERAIRNMEADDAVLRDHLGDAYLMVGETDRAVQEWQRAHRMDPELEGVLEKINRYTE